MIKYATTTGNKEIKIDIETFIEKFNKKEAVLVDIRMPFEKKVWSLPFAIDMDPEKLEKEYEKLPKDKLIVTACVTYGRSPFCALFLKEKGLNAKFLDEGLLKLMERLKGNKAKDFKLD